MTAAISLVPYRYRPSARLLCRVGLHAASRTARVHGWVGFNEVRHDYCACGTRRWMVFNRTTVECERVAADFFDRYFKEGKA